MLHAPALPGSPGNTLTLDEIRSWVLRDGDALAGVDAMILENFGDAPFYPRRAPRHTAAFMSVLAREVKAHIRRPLGINVLRNDGLSALAVAAAANADFIRVNVYTGARLADQGILQGEAHRIQRYRKLLGAGVRVWADVAVKHSAPLAARDLSEEVEDTIQRGRADAIIVSGPATGKSARMEDLEAARRACGGTPLYAGSGVTAANVRDVLSICDGAIVGTCLKRDGVVTNPVDPARVREFIAAARERTAP